MLGYITTDIPERIPLCYTCGNCKALRILNFAEDNINIVGFNCQTHGTHSAAPFTLTCKDYKKISNDTMEETE